jgi:feruloyl esterase
MTRPTLAGVTAAAVVIVAAFSSAAAFQVSKAPRKPPAARSCESVARLALPNATVTSTTTVSAGTFVPPPAIGGGGAPAAADAALTYGQLPAFCRVLATLTPSTDSDIKIEVWLPAANWNGKFQAVGNGGWAGVISYGALASAVASGYAAASTDTGHVGNNAAFALGHPEKLIDFGYRAVHEMTTHAKAIVDAYYGKGPTTSIWNGCSQGGRQGITEAMRYPDDFNAIVAGAPALNLALLHAVRMTINRIVHRHADSYIHPEDYRVIHKAVLQACDAVDGVKDGVIDNPAVCRFDPKVLRCKGGDSGPCLTASQVDTAKALYAPIAHPVTGDVLFPPFVQPGSELGWGMLAGPDPFRNALESFRYVVFKDPSWDWRRLNPSVDIQRAVDVDAGVTGLTDPNLKPFFDRGGKLLMYHGWSDPQVPPSGSVKYFTDVVRTVGDEAVGKSIQLYMVPGMAHCRGGAGTDTFDKMGPIEQWIARGQAPESISASRVVEGKVVRTRPICPFGKVARWSGSGSSDDAANFACVAE